MPGHTAKVTALAFSPDSGLLATGSADRTVRVWDVGNQSSPRVLLGHSDSVNAITFSSDGKWIFSTSEDGSTLLWDATSGDKAATLMSLRESNDEELAKEYLYNIIYAGHPYGHHNVGKVSSLDKLTVEDVRNFYRSHYTAANLVIGLFVARVAAMRLSSGEQAADVSANSNLARSTSSASWSS